MHNNTATESRAFRASVTRELPLIGDPAISRAESLQIDTVYGLEVCHVDISRYGSVSWTLRDNDGERFSICVNPQGDRAEAELASAVVAYVGCLGYRTAETAVRANLDLLQRIQAAAVSAVADCERRLAEIAAQDAAATPAGV